MSSAVLPRSSCLPPAPPAPAKPLQPPLPARRRSRRPARCLRRRAARRQPAHSMPTPPVPPAQPDSRPRPIQPRIRRRVGARHPRLSPRSDGVRLCASDSFIAHLGRMGLHWYCNAQPSRLLGAHPGTYSGGAGAGFWHEVPRGCGATSASRRPTSHRQARWQLITLALACSRSVRDVPRVAAPGRQHRVFLRAVCPDGRAALRHECPGRRALTTRPSRRVRG